MNASLVWTVYIDGSAVPNPGKLRIGGVVYAPDGTVVYFSEPLPQVGCNNEAEALAVIHALSWLKDLGDAASVRIFTDSSILVEQLTLPTPKPIVRLADVYAQARSLFQSLPDAKAQWIPRKKNAVADALASGDLEAAGLGTAQRISGRPLR